MLGPGEVVGNSACFAPDTARVGATQAQVPISAAAASGSQSWAGPHVGPRIRPED